MRLCKIMYNYGDVACRKLPSLSQHRLFFFLHVLHMEVIVFVMTGENYCHLGVFFFRIYFFSVVEINV